MVEHFHVTSSPTLSAKIVALQGGVAHLKVVANPASYMQEYNVEHAKGEIGKQI